MRAERELKTGSFAHPFSRTPRFVGSIKKCLTYSSLLGGFEFMLEGKVATFKASPNAPGNEFESLTTKVPGAWLRSILIANKKRLHYITLHDNLGRKIAHTKSLFFWICKRLGSLSVPSLLIVL